jgi:hypothetical protein
MATTIRNPKQFWAGLLYAALGGAAVLIARDYGFGASSKMGPGYFPTVLGSLLLLVGLVSIVRAFVVAGEPVGAIAWKGLVLVTAGTVLFGLLLRPAGLVVAVVTLALVAAAASTRFRFEWRAAALLVGLVVFCALVFVKGLGLRVPLFGEWFGA